METRDAVTNIWAISSSSMTANGAASIESIHRLESCTSSTSPLYIDSWFNIDCDEIQSIESMDQYARPCTEWHVIDLLHPITFQIDQKIHPSDHPLKCDSADHVVGYLETECIRSVEQTHSVHPQCVHSMVVPDDIEEITVRFIVDDIARLSAFNLSVPCRPASSALFELSARSVSETHVFPMRCSGDEHDDEFENDKDKESDNVLYAEFGGHELSLSPNEEYTVLIQLEVPLTTTLCTESSDHRDQMANTMTTMVPSPSPIDIVDVYYNDDHRVEPTLNIELIRPNQTLQAIPFVDDADRNSTGLLNQVTFHIISQHITY